MKEHLRVEKSKQLEILANLVEVEIKENDFLKIVETLTRIGIASTKEDTLYQSCHILHKSGKYYILHFKHLLTLDGLKVNITEEDVRRYETICLLLEQWQLIKIINTSIIHSKIDLRLIKIVTYKDKLDWKLERKFTIGK